MPSEEVFARSWGVHVAIDLHRKARGRLLPLKREEKEAHLSKRPPLGIGVGAVRVRRPVLHQHTCYVRPRLLLAQLAENANLISNLPLFLHKSSKPYRESIGLQLMAISGTFLFSDMNFDNQKIAISGTFLFSDMNFDNQKITVYSNSLSLYLVPN